MPRRCDFIAGPSIASVRRWTIAAIDCYKRGCICTGCIYKKVITHQKCKMKYTVLKLVKKFGKPVEVVMKAYDME